MGGIVQVVADLPTDSAPDDESERKIADEIRLKRERNLNVF